MLVGIDAAAKPSTKCDEIISERSIIAFTDEAYYSHGVLQTRKLGKRSILILGKLLFQELIIQKNLLVTLLGFLHTFGQYLVKAKVHENKSAASKKYITPLCSSAYARWHYQWRFTANERLL